VPAHKLRCHYCHLLFYASRSDSKWHSPRCRYLFRMEDAKFSTPALPKSGVEGVTFSRVRKRWEVRVRVESGEGLKYVGSFGDLEAALKFRKEVLGA
jgi:hypothetical protein